MAERDDSQERTEQPTPRRLEQAREKGQVVRSRELTTMAVLVVAAAGVFLMGPGIVRGMAGLLRWGLSQAPAGLADPWRLPALMEYAALESLRILAPFFVLIVAAALVAPLALGGWSFAAEALSFKPERMDPVQGLKRILGPRGLMELAKALAKFLVVAAVALWLLWTQMDTLLELGREEITAALRHTGGLLEHSFLVLCMALVLIAGVDVPFQLWEHGRQLRMSRQELKDEFKETEGRPEVKSRIRNLQREVAQRRMMEELPKADVIVTNPTHYAVALRYAPESMSAPRVVAKGADLIAARIRDTAREHGIPTISAPPLARALYFNTRVNQQVPAGLYVAVAQVLAYVFQLRVHRERGAPPPSPPEDLPIPEELRRGEA